MHLDLMGVLVFLDHQEMMDYLVYQAVQEHQFLAKSVCLDFLDETDFLDYLE